MGCTYSIFMQTTALVRKPKLVHPTPNAATKNRILTPFFHGSSCTAGYAQPFPQMLLFRSRRRLLGRRHQIRSGLALRAQR